MGRRTSLALGLVAAATGLAGAGPKKTVQVETKPKGASVFLGTTDNGEKCKTPCAVEVDGETTLIVQLDGHRPKIEQLVFGRRERAPFKRSYVLEAMIGQLKIDGPAGAVVTIDGAEKGKLPFEEDVPAGKRAIVVKLDGKELYSNTIEVAEDEESKITVPSKPSRPTNVAEGGDNAKDPDGPGDPDDPNGPTKVRKTGPAKPRAGRLFALSATSSVGFRTFTYKNVPPNTMRDDRGKETENGQVLAGGLFELWPGNLAGVRALRGLSLAVTATFGVNRQTVIENESTMIGVDTFWGNVDVGLRQKWVFADQFGVEVNAGYVRDQFQYTGFEDQILKVPDVLYQAVRIGGRASLALGSIEPYAGFDTRVVMSGGNLQARFPAGADATGFHAVAGVSFVAAQLAGGSIKGMLEGSLTRYSWTFTPDTMIDTDGATDSIAYVAFSLGYAY
jgi:hypothetical protein